MFSLSRPNHNALDRFLKRQSLMGLTYHEVGATAAWGDDPALPRGYHFDRARTALGSGGETFLAAAEALRQWRQFEVGWADVTPADTPLEPGKIVAVRARVLGLWTLHACRIVYAIDDERDSIRRFGFGYGTLPGHAETGEERFLVAWDRRTDAVTYEVAAFVRPRHPLAVIGAPHAKRLADRFRRESAAAMTRAVGESLASASSR